MLQALRAPINPAAISILAAYTILWGFWILSPFWDVFSQADLYVVMNHTMPEWLWGLIAILFGAIMMRGVIVDSKRSLTDGAFSGFCHWIVISGLYFTSNWRNTGGITSMMIAVYCGYIYLNIRLNHE